MESKSITNELEHLRAELARARALLDVVLDHHPDGITIIYPDGTLRTNAVGSRMTGGTSADETTDAQVRADFTFYQPDRVTLMSFDETPAMRAMTTGQPAEGTIWMKGGTAGDGLLLQSSASPLPGGGAIVTFRDVTEKEKLETDLAARTEALAQRDAENRELVARLRAALDDLSAPVLEVAEDVLVLPIIGVVDSHRTAQICARLLDQVARSGAKQVIIDVTGVDVIDTTIADRLGSLARAVQMLGAHCVLSGIQPAVASTMIDLGITLAGIDTERNLRRALESSLPKTRARKERKTA